ncbi:MAG: Gallidermin [Rhodobacteraceae bacterium HLUCCA12]|nr:MAG: Gallidermin [Rhodobacteraceae bacterium HLUCCA12]
MARFESFVVLAEMRTGSNFLETTLNEFEGVTCHGELFNPSFINKPDTDAYLGIGFAQREADPLALLSAVRTQGGLTGFRLFHDHDPRIRAHVLADPGCAKIVLTRNPLDSYVSRKIAAGTGQWKLHNVANLKTARAEFDAAEFETHLTTLQRAQLDIQHALQTSGQSAFYITYDDLGDVDVLNGLARWLGIAARIDAPSRKLKKQNPEPVEDKLANPQDLAPALARLDRFDLGRTPSFEPRRAPMLPACHAGLRTPLLFMPLRGAPEGEVVRWMAGLDGVTPRDLPRDFDARRLRDWRRANPGFRSFTVLRHPLRRAWDGFSHRILGGEVRPVREHLARLYGVDLPDDPATLTPDDRRAAFLAYLRFARASLSGQTGLRPWPFWASQAALLDGYCQVAPPDHLLREDALDTDLPRLAEAVGRIAPSPWEPAAQGMSPPADAEVQAAAREAYWRDYEQFGFADL